MKWFCTRNGSAMSSVTVLRPPCTHLAMDRHVRDLSLLKSICYLLYIYMELYAIQLFTYLLYKSVCYYVPSDFQRTRCWRPSDCLGLEPCGVNSALPWLSRGLGCCPCFSVGTLGVSGTGMPGNGKKAGTPRPQRDSHELFHSGHLQLLRV